MLAAILIMALGAVILGAALGYLGRQQCRVGADQRAYAFALLPDDHTPYQQAHGRHGRCGREQGIQQFTHTHDACAQLAQPEDHANGDAVFFKMGVDAVDSQAAGIKPVAVLLDHCSQGFFIALLVEECPAQFLNVGRQGVKRSHVASGLVHAQPQLG